MSRLGRQEDDKREPLDLLNEEIAAFIGGDGDFDIVISSPAFTMLPTNTLLLQLKYALLASRFARQDDVSLITGAKVPIVKLASAPEFGSFRMDVCFNSPKGPLGAQESLRLLEEVDKAKPEGRKRVEAHALLLKTLLRTHGLDEVRFGGLSGMTIFCLAVSFLDHSQGCTLAADFLHLLRKYAVSFDFSAQSLALFNGGATLSKTQWLRPSEIRRDRLSIVHPVEPTRDVAAGSHLWPAIRQKLRAAYGDLSVFIDRGHPLHHLAFSPTKSALSMVGIRASQALLDIRERHERIFVEASVEALVKIWSPVASAHPSVASPVASRNLLPATPHSPHTASPDHASPTFRNSGSPAVDGPAMPPPPALSPEGWHKQYREPEWLAHGQERLARVHGPLLLPTTTFSLSAHVVAIRFRFAELRADLRDADLEQGVVRGEPVESRTERIMRSMKKGGSGGASRQQQYSAIGGDDDGVKRSRSSRSSRSTGGGDGEGKHRHKRYKDARLYALDKPNPSSGGGDPAAPGAVARGEKKPTRWWLWALLAILVLAVIAGVVFAVMHFSKNKNSTDLSSSNSTAANSTLGEDNTGNSTSPLAFNSSASHGLMSAAAGSMGASDISGLLGAATSGPSIPPTSSTKTFNDGQYHPASTAASASMQTQGSNTGIPFADFSTLPATGSTSAQNAQPTQVGDSTYGAQQSQGFNVGQWGSFSSADGNGNIMSMSGASPTTMPDQQQGGASAMSYQQPSQQNNGNDHGWNAFSNAQQTRPAPGAEPTTMPDGQDQHGQPSSPSSMGANPWQGQGQDAQSHSQGQQQGQNDFGWNQPQPTGQPGQQQPQQSSNPNGQQENGWNGPQQNGWNGQHQPQQNGDGIVPLQTKTAFWSASNGPSPTRSDPAGAQPSSGGGNGPWPSNGDSPNAQPSSGGGHSHWPSSSNSPATSNQDNQQYGSSGPLGVGPVVVGQGQDSHGMFSNSTAYQAEEPEAYQTYEGKGTWFEASMHYGACGWATNNTDYVVAISNDMWLDSSTASAPSAAAATAPSASKKPVSFASSWSASSGNSTTPTFCGAEVLITNKENGRSIKAWVTERCGYCEGSAALDLSIPVFTALFPDSSSQQDILDIGTVDLLWGFTGQNVGLNLTLAGLGAGGNLTASDGGSSSDEQKKDGENKEGGGGWFSGWFGGN
ncbi:DNA polymerase sigma-like protein [Rhodotorula toruloides]|uniref:DNA polymerase sigma-like protein n=1 Tax=Rhodotorula toruloides TaxID=5286 RepID=A0A511KQ56_RHOTO|nr:DNA polymerase sigma-like protein [Rhodotorula toruloides]